MLKSYSFCLLPVGLMYDASGSYDIPFVVMGCAVALGSFVVLLLGIIQWRNLDKTSETSGRTLEALGLAGQCEVEDADLEKNNLRT